MELQLESFFQNLDVSPLFFVGKSFFSERLICKLESAFEVLSLQHLGLHVIQLVLHHISLLEDLRSLPDMVQLQRKAL